MLFHMIRNLRTDCSGVGFIELSMLVPQAMLLTYWTFGL